MKFRPLDNSADKRRCKANHSILTCFRTRHALLLVILAFYACATIIRHYHYYYYFKREHHNTNYYHNYGDDDDDVDNYDDGVAQPETNNTCEEKMASLKSKLKLKSKSKSKSRWRRDVLFIGGVPRSGTTLMRVILDSHPEIRCDAETHLLPHFASWYAQISDPFEQGRLAEAGIGERLVRHIFARSMLEVIEHRARRNDSDRDAKSQPPEYHNYHHHRPNTLLCAKDPFLLSNAIAIKRLLPRAKFIFMIRDGRAVVNSVITRKIKISQFNYSDFGDCLKIWNNMVENMWSHCTKLGNRWCLKVRYENLILDPVRTIEIVLRFLQLPWNDSVLRHDRLIRDGRIHLSLLERSTDQVIRPINLEPLTAWMHRIPQSIAPHVGELAPMLETLGYGSGGVMAPENYGVANDFVRANQMAIDQDAKQWEDRRARIAAKQAQIRAELSRLSNDLRQFDRVID